jgi:hypothetical protein
MRDALLHDLYISVPESHIIQHMAWIAFMRSAHCTLVAIAAGATSSSNDHVMHAQHAS